MLIYPPNNVQPPVASYCKTRCFYVFYASILYSYILSPCSLPWYSVIDQVLFLLFSHCLFLKPKIRALSHCGVCLCRAFPGSVSGDGAAGPSPELLASLQSLGDDDNDSDYTLLPHSLHQVCVCVWGKAAALYVSKSRGNVCLHLVRQNGCDAWARVWIYVR